MRHVLFGLVLVCGCGRIGFDGVSRIDDPPPGPDAGCPGDTAKVPVTAARMSASCIEKAQRGSATWTDAKADCEGLGRRLCADAEWLAACLGADGVTEMIGDYEWVAEEAAGVAKKRGSSACDDSSEHEIFVDPFGYRCCIDL
jgi:hypothetical protein